MTDKLKPHEILAKELEELGLHELAAGVDKGLYHDFLSPFPNPTMRMVRDLAVKATRYPNKSTAIMAIRRRVIDGEFDATKEESDQWAASPEGQATIRSIVVKDKT